MKNNISLKTVPPGSNAKIWINKDAAFVSGSYTRSYPLVVKSGNGAYVEDVDGNVYLDFSSGIACCATGHCHPAVVGAIKRQCEKLIHMSGTDFYYSSQIELAKKLTEITPGTADKKAFFCNSGAEAVEASIKLARYSTTRSRIIAFNGSFHGRTMGALSLTASKVVQKRGFSPFVPGVTHMEYAYCYRCPYNLSYPECSLYCAEWLEHKLFKSLVPPEEVAAIIVEPIQGEGGYIVPPPGFHSKLKGIAERHGILYIMDEVQAGMGRTGKMMASEHFDIVPDIVSLAKGIASGMPLGACVAPAGIMDWEPGSHASTFGGNPISCEASLATIALLEESLIENSAYIGNYILSSLKNIQDRFEIIGDVRGMGLMIGIEFVKDRKTKERAVEQRDRVVEICFKKGLVLLGCGENSIRFVPPLIIDKNDADTALAIFEEAVSAV